jgi:ankyrin repeat protein
MRREVMVNRILRCASSFPIAVVLSGATSGAAALELVPPDDFAVALTRIDVLDVAAPYDDPDLVAAAKGGQWEAVRLLVEQGVDVNKAALDGTTALHWASYWDNVDIADLLIRRGADASAANDLGATPLWSASMNGSAAMVERLLKAGANVHAVLLSGETVVMTAARSGAADVVETLLAAGADPNGSATRGQTALMWAADERHSAVVEVLLRHGADVHARSDVWQQLWQTAGDQDTSPENIKWIREGGYTPLLFAARRGDLASAKLLVAAGADVNDYAASGVTATTLAVHSVKDHGYLPQSYRPLPLAGGLRASPHAEPPTEGEEVVEFLLESGADPNVDIAGYTALHAAILRHTERAVRALLAHGADPNAPLMTATPVRRASHDFFFEAAFVGATPFWLAARYQQPGVMRLLAEHGADPSYVHYMRQQPAGWRFTATAIMAAVGMPRGEGYPYRQPEDRAEREALVLECVKIAVELGVDPNAADADGRTAFEEARGMGYDSVAEFLVASGADPS